MNSFFLRTVNALVFVSLASLSGWGLQAQQNADSPELFMQTGHAGVIRSIDISFDGKLAATGGDDAAIRIWSLPEALELRRMAQGSGVRSVSLSPDGHHVAGLSYQNVAIWDVDSGVRTKSWSYFDSNPFLQGGLSYTADGKKIVVADRIRIFVWNIDSGQIDHVETFRQGITCFASQPKANLVAICQGDTVVLWDTQQYKTAGTIGPARSTFPVAPELAAAYREESKSSMPSAPKNKLYPKKLTQRWFGGLILEAMGSVSSQITATVVYVFGTLRPAPRLPLQKRKSRTI